jgi:putative inorganic carbon (HCO3(-)) transporter
MNAMLEKNSLSQEIDRAIFICLCAAIFYQPFTKAGVEICVWFSFFLWLLNKVLVYRSRGGQAVGVLPKTALNRALGLYVAANLASVIFSVNHGASLNGFFGKELKFMAIFFMTVDVVDDKNRLLGFVAAFIASAVVLLADAGVQYFIGCDFIREFTLDRLRASFSSASGFASWLIVAIPLFIGLLMRGSPLGRKGKFPLFLLVVLCLPCLLLTYSRGAWLGFVFGIFLMAGYAFYESPLKVKMISCGAVLGIVLIFWLLPQPVKSHIQGVGGSNFGYNGQQAVRDRIKSIAKMSWESSTTRVYLWNEALAIIKDHPLTGCGLNTYAKLAPRYKMSDTSGTYCHNSLLQKTAETGVFGLFAFLMVIVVFFRTGFQYLGQNKNPMVLGLLAGLLAFLVHSFFDNHFYALQLVVFFWFMMGLTMAVIRIESGQGSPEI